MKNQTAAAWASAFEAVDARREAAREARETAEAAWAEARAEAESVHWWNEGHRKAVHAHPALPT